MGDNRIYILPATGSTVFVFSSAGKYINSLKKGQGPGDILFVSDINVYNNELYVLDNYRVIRKYDKEGRFVGDVYRTDEPRFSFEYAQQALLLFDPNLNKRSNNMLEIILGNASMSFFSKEKCFKDLTFSNYIFYNKGYISWPLNDTIYHIQQNTETIVKVLPKYKVDFASRNFYDLSKDEEYTPEQMCQINQDKTYQRWITNVFPYGDSALFFSFYYDKTYFVRYEKGNVSIYPEFIKGLPEMINPSVGCTETQMIFTYNAYELIENRDSMFDSSDPAIKSLYDNISEDDNPVLIFVDVDG